MNKERKTDVIIIRVTEDQKKTIKKKAKRKQTTVSAYILSKTIN
jgi:uncharacterized protein (DUF1778 family)